MLGGQGWGVAILPSGTHLGSRHCAGLWGKESREACAWVLACSAQAVFHSRAETCKVATAVLPPGPNFTLPLELEMPEGDKNKSFSHDIE